MRKLLFSFLILVSIFYSLPSHALAIENPLSVKNNKIGIHILFDNELKAASQLVNSNGDWGYVTIVIQADDKDLTKWQTFMHDAKKYHLIPIVRLGTEGDYFNTKVWRKPTDTDIVDFANFLDSLDWPVKNRYVIIYNEVNRGDEWGGTLNPTEYAQLLSFAVTVFKSKSPDFFIIPSGLDNAAPNQSSLYMNEYNFMQQMNNAIPGIFNQVDRLSSHSYPNPGFSQPPSINTPTSISSFQYEKTFVKTLSSKELPIFITETGWSTDVIPDKTAAGYYSSAFKDAWNDPSIVAITPFLLQGRGGPFQKFSFFGANGSFTQQYQAIKNFPKTKGTPTIGNKVLAAETRNDKFLNTSPQTARDFSKVKINNKQIAPSRGLKDVFKWLMRI